MKPSVSGAGDPDDVDWLTDLQRLLDLRRAGDRSAPDSLVEWVERWQSRKISSKLHGFPGLRRWFETGDVMHEVSMELHGALAKRQPASAAEFLGLVGCIISRFLIDHQRSLFGPQGFAGKYRSSATKSDSSAGGGADKDAADPSQSAELAEMTVKLLEAVERLPEDQKQVIHLKYYQDLTLPAIARVMQIPLIRVNRLLARARLFLTKELGGNVK